MNKLSKLISLLILINTCCLQTKTIVNPDNISLSDIMKDYLTSSKNKQFNNNFTNCNLFTDAIKNSWNNKLNNNTSEKSNNFFEYFKDFLNIKKDEHFIILNNNTVNNSYSFDNAFKIAAPAVVSVFATNKENKEEITKDIDSYFNGNTKQDGLHTGSGFCVKVQNNKLYIATSCNILQNAKYVSVILGSNKMNNPNIVNARIHGTDTDNNIAVLEIDINDLPKESGININQLQINWSSIDNLNNQNQVYAIGNIFGIIKSLSSGVILSKTNETSIKMHNNDNSTRSAIKYNVAINSSYVGGILVTPDGKVIGIINNITDDNGIGVALSSDTARSIIDSLIDNSQNSNGWIGIETQVLSVEDAKNLGVVPPELQNKTANQRLLGTMVSSVQQNSPADRKGIKPGDIIIMVNNVIIDENNSLDKAISDCGIGNNSTFSILRKNLQTNNMDQINFDIRIENYNNLGGNDIKELGIDIKEESIDGKTQVLITKVINNNSKLSFQAGDVIISANSSNINNSRQLKDIVENFYRNNPNNEMTFLVNRKDANGRDCIIKISHKRIDSSINY